MLLRKKLKKLALSFFIIFNTGLHSQDLKKNGLSSLIIFHDVEIYTFNLFSTGGIIKNILKESETKKYSNKINNHIYSLKENEYIFLKNIKVKIALEDKKKSSVIGLKYNDEIINLELAKPCAVTLKGIILRKKHIEIILFIDTNIRKTILGIQKNSKTNNYTITKYDNL